MSAFFMLLHPVLDIIATHECGRFRTRCDTQLQRGKKILLTDADLLDIGVIFQVEPPHIVVALQRLRNVSSLLLFSKMLTDFFRNQDRPEIRHCRSSSHTLKHFLIVFRDFGNRSPRLLRYGLYLCEMHVAVIPNSGQVRQS